MAKLTIEVEDVGQLLSDTVELYLKSESPSCVLQRIVGGMRAWEKFSLSSTADVEFVAGIRKEIGSLALMVAMEESLGSDISGHLPECGDAHCNGCMR